jgi:hypothetical protein
MMVNRYNKQVLGQLAKSIDEFDAGSIDLDAVQSKLQQTTNLLENDGSGARDLVGLAEADIERIQFTKLQAEQRAAAMTRLNVLREALREDDDL